METIKSPLRYPGGKGRAAERIVKKLPDFDEYREPFLGGGSVFVHLKQIYPNKRYWINDIYNSLFVFWKEAKENPAEIISQVQFWKDKFNNGKDLFKYLKVRINSFNPVEKAAAFFILNRITFSGTTESGGFSDFSFHNRFTDSSIVRLSKLPSILENTTITNYDYQQVVDEPGDNVFLFLDPPYYSATKSALYGKNGELHKHFDHERFASVMKNVKHKWLITYDDSKYIKNLFSFANIQHWQLKYGMRNVRKGINSSSQIGKELFIANYSIDVANEEQLPAWISEIENERKAA